MLECSVFEAPTSKRSPILNANSELWRADETPRWIETPPVFRTIEENSVWACWSSNPFATAVVIAVHFGTRYRSMQSGEMLGSFPRGCIYPIRHSTSVKFKETSFECDRSSKYLILYHSFLWRTRWSPKLFQKSIILFQLSLRMKTSTLFVFGRSSKYQLHDPCLKRTKLHVIDSRQTELWVDF